MSFEVQHSVFRNALFHGDLVNAKAAAILDQMITICFPMAIGFVFVRFGFRAIQQALGRVFGHEHDGVLFNLQELAGAVVLCVCISMFGALSVGLGSSITYFNQSTKLGDEAAQGIQDHYQQSIDAHINNKVAGNMKKMEHILADNTGKYDAATKEQCKKAIAVYKITGGGAEGLETQGLYQQLEDVSDNAKDASSWNPITAIGGMWNAVDFGNMLREAFHSLFQGIASIIRQIVAAVSLMGFQVMLCLGPLAFALEVFFRGTWSQWFRYTLSLGLVNTVFNILDHFMDRNFKLLIGQDGWENAATTWEAVSFDITMIAMYIMAFRLIGKVIGDGSGGAISQKVIGMAAMIGGAAMAGAAYAPALAGKGFKGMSDLRKSALKGHRRRKARGMARNITDDGQ